MSDATLEAGDHRAWEEGIATGDLAERYVLGRLGDDEEARFEDHLVACPRCQDEVAAARGLRLGLRAVAAQEAAGVAVRAGLVAWLRRHGALLAAGLVVLLIAGAVLLRVTGDARRLEAVAADARDEAAALRAELADERAARAEAERTAAAATGDGDLRRPLAGLPVHLLALARSDEAGATVIDLATAGDAVVLAVDAAADPRFVAHRVTFEDAAGTTVFHRDGLQPDALEAILLTFPTTWFAPGTYRLELYGVRADGGSERLASHLLEVRR